tara:strand:- start:56 stop:550 length:495 start_codon:yes stop_codon:yes gene_type:complete
MHEEDVSKNLMKKYDLDAGKEEMHYINQSKVYTVPGIRDEADFDELIDSCKVIEMSDDDIEQVLHLVAAVLHIGNLQYVMDASKSEDEAVTIKESDSLKFVAKHLQVPADDLKTALTTRGIGKFFLFKKKKKKEKILFFVLILFFFFFSIFVVFSSLFFSLLLF